MEGSRDYAYYKEHAQDVKLEDITSSERNKNIMQKLRDGDSEFESYLGILDEPMEDDDCEFIVQRSDDLGWLGYFIGENKRLGELFIKCDLPPGTSFVEGFCRNRSIKSLHIDCDVGDYLSLGNILGNCNLNSLEVGCIGNAHDFAVALGQRSHLKCLHFEYIYLSDDFSDEEISGIAQALSAQPQLEDLQLESIGFEGNGWATLATTFMGWGRNSQLKKLDLPFNNIDDEGLQNLLRGIANCRNLVELKLLGNNQITVAGLRHLSGFFQSESCKLECLNLDRVDMGNEGAITLATGLVDYKLLKSLDLSDNAMGDEGIVALVSGLTTAANTGLETLKLSGNAFTTAGIRSLSTLIQSERSTLKNLSLDSMRIDDDGISILADALTLTHNTSLESLVLDLHWSPNAGNKTLSRLLCDTSSMNNIYFSNHTLQTIGWDSQFIDDGKYFDLNRQGKQLNPINRRLVPMCKILIHHPDLADMKPFYKWKLKVLPVIADWFRSARGCKGFFEESIETFQRRQLSAMYRFIRGVPMLVADGFWRQQLKQVRVKKRRVEEVEKQLLEILAKKRKLEEEEMQVLDRLSGQRASL